MKLGRYFSDFVATLLFLVAPFVGAQPLSNSGTGAHILIIAALQDDPALIAMEEVLNAQNKSYKVLLATQDKLTDEVLFDANGKGLYSAVILTEGNLAFYDGSGWRSAFDQQEWEKLWAYEKTYGARQVSLYTYPGAEPEDYGLRMVQPVDTSVRAVSVSVTDKGKEIFGQLAPFVVSGAYGYLSKLEPVIGVESTPLIADETDNIMAVYSSFEGRERIALTMSQNRNAEHSRLLFPGLISWLAASPGVTLTSEITSTRTLTLEYILFLVGLSILAILLSSWLIQRQRAKKQRRPQNSFYNF
ncbi:MAG: hypothetical protein KC422_05145 [Trueperaceae bacterium]|nr:hypothetical protein [Trueperaceae bacterium]